MLQLLSLVALALTASWLVPSPDNSGPVCAAGGDIQAARQGPQTTLQLDGSGSYDVDGDPLVFTWTSGCPGAVFANPSASATTLTFDTPAGQTTSCAVRLRVFDGQASSFCRLYITITDDPKEPRLDIKPGSCPNPVNTKGCGGGTVTVALTGSAQFDVLDVDPDTLELVRHDGKGWPVTTCKLKFDDVATPYLDELCGCHELQCDGILDLKLQYKRNDLVQRFLLKCEPDKSSLQIDLRGKLLDGTDFVASDCIWVLGK